LRPAHRLPRAYCGKVCEVRDDADSNGHDASQLMKSGATETDCTYRYGARMARTSMGDPEVAGRANDCAIAIRAGQMPSRRTAR
jgi:hypothetical protein